MGEGPSIQRETPEAIFLAWLFAQPQGADIAGAARIEIGRLDRIDMSEGARTRLAALLTQATVTPQGASRKARRQKH